MSKLYILFLSFLFISALNAQIVDYQNSELFEEYPQFNIGFIKSNQIKSIRGFYSTKNDFDKIRPNSNTYVYEFNINGQLLRDYKTAIKDTTVRSYVYDEFNNCVLIRKSDKFGFHSYHYEYDSLNRITLKEYRRDLNGTQNRLNFQLDRSFLITSQSYSYENTKEGYKKYYYNSSGKIYQTEYFFIDEHGYLTKQEARTITGAGSFKIEYDYNNKGLIKEKRTISKLIDTSTSRITFEYDEFDNLMAQYLYRNSKYITEYQIVYESSTMLLSALLARDVSTNTITILKFSDFKYFN